MEAPVPKGPLAARWRSWSVEQPRAGAFGRAHVEVENAGTAPWVSRGPLEGIQLAYHWLDERGNAIVWDGWRTPLPHAVPPGDVARVTMRVQAPLPPGGYRLALDLVDEGRFWFAELGNRAVELDVDVAPRIGRALAVRVSGRDAETERALAAQEERLVAAEDAEAIAHLAAGCLPPPEWSRRVLDAHQEGYAFVGGSIEPVGGPLARRAAARRLAAWAPGAGRVPGFAAPLLCPSIVHDAGGAELETVEGLPALRPPAGAPALYDGRITVRVRVPLR